MTLLPIVGQPQRPGFYKISTIIENTMASQGDSKSAKTSDTLLLATPSEGSGKVRSDNHPAEEPHNTSRKTQNRFLSHRDAEAGGPADYAACGEEDPGVALEMLVEQDDERNCQ